MEALCRSRLRTKEPTQFARAGGEGEGRGNIEGGWVIIMYSRVCLVVAQFKNDTGLPVSIVRLKI